MLLYTLKTAGTCCWVLDLAGPSKTSPAAPVPCIYALVPTRPPLQAYIGSTVDLHARVKEHLSRSRTELARVAGSQRQPGTSAATVLRSVIGHRSNLLVIRLEILPSRNRKLLRLLELAWLIVATREELPTPKRRGPHLEWPGDPGNLRKAFALARKRHWPGKWITALRPLCENRCVPELIPTRPPAPPPGGKRRGRPPKGRAAKALTPQEATRRPPGRLDFASESATSRADGDRPPREEPERSRGQKQAFSAPSRTPGEPR